MNIGFISLGCAKNLVDSEMILKILVDAGCQIVSDPKDADALFINTCGFIDAAKDETLQTIREMKAFGKKMIVTGCYAHRYENKLKKEMPFIDRIITLRDYPKIHLILADIFSDLGLKFQPLKYENRLLTGSLHSPYVKISEGCNNRCSYCAIPLIRGAFRSRTIEDIVSECETLVQQGAKELNLISQDTTRFGSDQSEDHKSQLVTLLQKVSKIEGLKILRILYLYPDEVTEELIQEIKQNPVIANYFDIPIQHISDTILKRMYRRGDGQFIKTLLSHIREEIPDSIIRTTYIVGFPGETKEDFKALYDFTENFGFDRLGVFAYSREEDTDSYHFDGQIPGDIKQARVDQVMALQQRISRKKQRKMRGTVHQTLIEAYDPETSFYYGRSYAFAPDDIDGMIVFQSEKPLSIGDFVAVKIKTNFDYDLIGDAIFSEE